MKAYIVFLYFVFGSIVAVARGLSEGVSNKSGLYIGANLTTVSYHIYYDEPEIEKYTIKSGYFNPFLLSLGYEINERARVQIGLAYGGSRDSYDWYLGDADTLLYKDKSQTRVIAIPVTGKFVFFNANKCFPIYGTATVMPAFGTTDIKRTEVHRNESAGHSMQVKGTDVFATAGIGLNYKISHRFNGYLEYLFFKKNLTSLNSQHQDWNQFATLPNRIYRSLAFGIEYSFASKHE
ncbi:outer membrane beta-barrel protein [Pontibacter flavimaris]|uniref:Outer membrane protein beta-barrel domain-containing protein n=1 Tax=Pontibacter flavimaris TaxID=1797110 RepID=A0A1Q5PEU2_9BACT|nr:outer membrane beta-barrel protein [Pontibacter flavimaris]OKL40744.1 hypothetical protein A3841_12895 [Pontibacter flavimaris]